MFPFCLHLAAYGALCMGFLCALAIAADEIRHPQRMWIMNIVWPVCALFGTVLWLWGYLSYGRLAALDNVNDRATATKSSGRQRPFATSVGIAASHCGAGCTLGDICAEWLAFALPSTEIALGYRIIFSERVFAIWVLDYIFALLIGVMFQYFTIAPMHNWRFAKTLWAAIKADVLSLTSWQLGMYGFMAIANFYIFRHQLGISLPVDSVEFWFMMQIAMIFGFLTAFPMNWWLIRKGIKAGM